MIWQDTWLQTTAVVLCKELPGEATTEIQNLKT